MDSSVHLVEGCIFMGLMLFCRAVIYVFIVSHHGISCLLENEIRTMLFTYIAYLCPQMSESKKKLHFLSASNFVLKPLFC